MDCGGRLLDMMEWISSSSSPPLWTLNTFCFCDPFLLFVYWVSTLISTSDRPCNQPPGRKKNCVLVAISFCDTKQLCLTGHYMPARCALCHFARVRWVVNRPRQFCQKEFQNPSRFPHDCLTNIFPLLIGLRRFLRTCLGRSWCEAFDLIWWVSSDPVFEKETFYWLVTCNWERHA